MKQILTIILLFIGISVFGQSTTYKNNFGANIINGSVGNFQKSSFSWTITQIGNKYKIKTNAVSKSFNVSYSKFDNKNKLYIYKVTGSGIFDGNLVKLIMTNGKLSDYAKGTQNGGNLLTILFTDNTGYIYKLKMH